MKNLPMVALVLFLFVCPLTLLAQNYAIPWSKIASGGSSSSSAQYVISGTIGQHDASPAINGGTYSLVGGFWAVSAVQTPGAPTLFIMTTGSSAVLYWSTTSTSAYHLESNNNLAAVNGWGTVPANPVTANGFNYITNPITSGNRFYRLHSP